MRETFGLQVGYSDHTEGIDVPIAASALGATVIEKHFTLDQEASGPDHAASIEPPELKRMVEGIRRIELALGSEKKKCTSSERQNLPLVRKSIVAAKAIRKGELFSEENLTVKRPASGISPMLWDGNRETGASIVCPRRANSDMKKVCVVTGSRADYGLLRGVMARLQVSPTCKLQVIVTGMHLANEFGQTWSTIESDGFSIDWKVEMLLGSDTEVGVSKSVGLAMLGFSDAYEHLRPDLVLLLGDRFEIFAAASSAIIAGIPIAHLHGGEITSGSLDDTLRHCITKMADLHFTAAEIYRQRYSDGREPDKGWCVGALEGCSAAVVVRAGRAADAVGHELEGNVLLITFHQRQ